MSLYTYVGYVGEQTSHPVKSKLQSIYSQLPSSILASGL